MPTSRRHYRVTLGDAIAAHERAVGRFGGRKGIHDVGRIEAAIARPYLGCYRPIYKKAAALLEAVVMNHGFVDGNKRTAFMLFYLFLEKSGYALSSTGSDEIDDAEHLIYDLTIRFLNFDEVANWLKHRIKRVEGRA